MANILIELAKLMCFISENCNRASLWLLNKAEEMLDED